MKKRLIQALHLVLNNCEKRCQRNKKVNNYNDDKKVTEGGECARVHFTNKRNLLDLTLYPPRASSLSGLVYRLSL